MSDWDPDDPEDWDGKPPPRDTRYPKGVSGNPAGRTPGSRRDLPYPALLDELITITIDGKKQAVPNAVAFQMQRAKKGVEGDHVTRRGLLEDAEKARAAGTFAAPRRDLKLQISYVAPGCPINALIILKLAVRHDAFGPGARIKLEPLIVEMALARMGDRQLTTAEQRIVHEATRTPKKVKWPTWWSEIS